MKSFYSIQILAAIILVTTARQAGAQSFPPANTPAEFIVVENELSILYSEMTLMQAQIKPEGIFMWHAEEFHSADRINSVAIFESGRYDKTILIEGIIELSGESFPCEARRPASGFKIVRHSSGLSHSLLNRAVYDRLHDLLLSVDPGCEVEITPQKSSSKTNRYRIKIRGSKIVIRFQPNYYRNFKGLANFRPWEYQIKKESIAGWCSWFAYFKKIDEVKMRRAADILQETLLPYGYQYLQMDDGYQRQPWGTPSTWLRPNPGFPSGLDSLAGYISSRGLKPGIWTYASFGEKEFVARHPDWFVRDQAGNPAKGRWVNYIMDASVNDVLDSLISPVYKGFKNMGWAYFKIDGLRHLRYEGYNSYKSYFDEKTLNRATVFRNFVKRIRQEVGEESYLLGCWGIRPELIGLIDACRIGGDGFSFAGLSQFNSWNNVVWRNDPDHIELSSEDAYAACMVTSLTGSLVMLTDDPELYLTAAIEPAKRISPVLFTLPGQVYDADPSRSEAVHLVNGEVSGEGERPFDASRETTVNLYLLEVNREFENWCVLGYVKQAPEFVEFTQLGLDPDKQYHVFDFWNREYLGEFSEGFSPGGFDSLYKCGLFCLREKTGHPQLLATGRHISCGGLELRDLQWNGSSLSGTCWPDVAETYTLYIQEPLSHAYESIEYDGGYLVGNKLEGLVRIIEFKPIGDRPLNWNIDYLNSR